MSEELAWQSIARRKQQEQQSRTPKEWLLKTKPAPNRNNVLAIPKECGILSSQDLSITEDHTTQALIAKLQSGKLKAVDVVTAFCKRAAIAQQLTCCLTEIMFKEAISHAKDLDAYMAKTGKAVGPLHGLPISIKDSFCVKGFDTSIGYAALCFKPAEINAPLVDILMKAGAVIHCKTNVPLTLSALDSHNNVFGRVLNPGNMKLTAGGSSGGEGALVAMKGSVFGVGTDVGGSIRVPAMCNGLVGFKPSHGRVPYAGQESGTLPGGETLGIRSVAGPIARSVEDCELFFQIMGDYEPWVLDPECVPQTWSQQLSLKDGQSRSGSGILKVGVMRTDGITTPLPPIQSLLDEVAKKLGTSNGIEVVELDLTPILSQCQKTANGLFSVDGANSSFDLLEASGEPISPWLSTRLKRRKGLDTNQIRTLQATRNTLQTDLLKIWRSEGGYWNISHNNNNDGKTVGKQVDVLICPVAPHPTPAIDTWNTVSYTAAFNLLDCPAGTIPIRPISISDLKNEMSEVGSGKTNGWDTYNRKLWQGDRGILLGSDLSIQIVGKIRQEKKLMAAMKMIRDACLDLRDESKTKSKL